MSRGINRVWIGTAAGGALAGLLGAAGCAEPAVTPERVPLGNAVLHNAAQHIIDPNPPGAWAGAPDLDGARAADAIQRYRAGTVTEPDTVETSSFGELR